MKLFEALFILFLFVIGLGVLLIITGNISMVSVRNWWVWMEPIIVPFVAAMAVFGAIGLFLWMLDKAPGGNGRR